jgi:hypothetical protein
MRPSNENNVPYETRYSPPTHAIPMNSPPPPKEMQSSLAKRTQKIPPPLRPKRPDESQIPHEIFSPPYGLPALRQIRSAEVFNHPPVPQQPTSPSFSPPMMTAPLPPRRSSRRTPPYQNDDPKASFTSQQPTANDLGLSSEWDRLLPFYNTRPGNHREAQIIPYNQSMVQQDTSISKPHPSPLFSPPLEQVPEEPEGINTPRDSTEFNRKTSLRHTKSSPNISRSSSANRILPVSPAIPKVPELPMMKEERPVSQGSDTLGDLSRRSFAIKSENDNTKSKGNRDTVASWEEDVDFCYKHAAEANCEFDWNNVSRFLDAESSDDDTEFASALAKAQPTLKKQKSLSTGSSEDVEGFHDKSFFLQSIRSGQEGLPDLDYHSVHTGSSNSLSLSTPHTFNSGDSFKPPKSEEVLLFTSPQLPPLDLRGDLDSDQLYEELMVGFNIKEAQQQYLPILEPKAYSPIAPQKSINFSPQIGQNASSALKQRRFSNDRSKFPLPPAPTSAPVVSLPQLQPFVSSMSKELPPLPPESPRPIAPATIRVENLVAQLRSPRESPTEAKPVQFTPPSSAKPSPIPDQPPVNPMVRRRPIRTTENPMMKIQELSPQMLSRNGSEDTVVTTIFVPATPPDSPDQKNPLAPLLAPTNTPKPAGSRIPVPMVQRGLKHSPSLPTMLQLDPRRTPTDNAPSSPPGSPLGKVPTSPRLNYSLFPPQSRPPSRPRRLTTT